ncbi:hypothetical protein C7S14_2511 [Burkholderia cepacia]|nr:hypothetical protein C7S14_2511 [Burkholderia cepacia]
MMRAQRRHQSFIVPQPFTGAMRIFHMTALRGACVDDSSDI